MLEETAVLPEFDPCPAPDSRSVADAPASRPVARGAGAGLSASHLFASAEMTSVIGFTSIPSSRSSDFFGASDTSTSMSCAKVSSGIAGRGDIPGVAPFLLDKDDGISRSYSVDLHAMGARNVLEPKWRQARAT